MAGFHARGAFATGTLGFGAVIVPDPVVLGVVMGTVTQGTYQTLVLPAHYKLTITTPTGSTGVLQRFPESAGSQSSGSQVLSSGTTVSIGPYNSATRHRIDCLQGQVGYDPALVDFPTTEEVQSLIDSAIGTGTEGQIWKIVSGVPTWSNP